MELSGIGGINGPDGNGKHTKSELGIFSYCEGSIFNDIDRSDGNMDGYLTDEQLVLFYSKTRPIKKGSLSKEAEENSDKKASKSNDESKIDIKKRIVDKYKSKFRNP